MRWQPPCRWHRLPSASLYTLLVAEHPQHGIGGPPARRSLIAYLARRPRTCAWIGRGDAAQPRAAGGAEQFALLEAPPPVVSIWASAAHPARTRSRPTLCAVAAHRRNRNAISRVFPTTSTMWSH
ncbi:luciferase family oxidoreductase, group 1 [Mycobacterium ulcerans str. Harvey]|uniref:Luciferase family oxidoreductase, group 1 n=1 Tax=Mycobacterium ulcerans str. Harvey TaxID=1299332 RepID=A0ABN0QN88_MYCUL|nr:luciferase family oxidoreductase, group 1 [Mycobacterium ulcerans str. Harvey]